MPTGAKCPGHQVSTEVTAWENQCWVEGREQAATWQHENSLMQPQDVSIRATEVKQEEDAERAFAHFDSLKRHRENPPPECLSVSPEVALAKRRATERAHRDFQERLKRCLKT